MTLQVHTEFGNPVQVLADNNKAAKEKVKEKQYVVETVLKKDKADRGSVLETFDQELRNKQLRKSNSDPVPNNGNHKSSSDASKVNNAVEDTQPAGWQPFVCYCRSCMP